MIGEKKDNKIKAIIDKILSDAQSEYDKAIADAQTEADAVTAEYEAKRAAIAADYDERVKRIVESEEQKAASGTETAMRASVLEAKSAMVDEVFAKAAERICSLEGEEYFAFLEKLLISALDDRDAALKLSEQTGDEICTASEYAVYLNADDKKKYGAKLTEAAKAKYPDIKLGVAEAKSPIDGGLILSGGDIEANCTVSLLVARLREQTEREVCAMLFPSAK